MLAENGLHTERKSFQVAIDTGIALRVLDINGIAISSDTNGNMTDIPVTNRMDGFSRDLTCLHITTSMEMIGTRLSKISGQFNRIMYR